jgi:predicted transcriptional regulator
VIRETIDDLIDRLFAGETLPLMRPLIEDRGINEDEIAAMQALLKRLEEGEQ